MLSNTTNYNRDKEMKRHMTNIINQMFTERNSSTKTKETYLRSIKYYETLTGHTIEELIQIADHEETQNIRWKNTMTREWLLKYRDHLYHKYNISTAQLYLTAILTTYRHHEITIPTLPYYSTKGLQRTPPINYNDLPDRELLTECLKISTPLVRSIILLMSSSGISRIDLLNLTIQDYLQATQDYHDHPESVKYAIQDMEETDVIPVFHLRRQKTSQHYFTFCSHEAVKMINSYLLTRKETLTKDKPLLKINKRYINTVFEKLNQYFHLGKVGNYNRLRPHMLRKYHASQLAEAGMPTEHINILQGRKVTGVAHESYIRVNPDKLRDEYIEALPYLVIEDINKFKTENQQLKEENQQYREKEEKINNILERLERLEKM